MTTIMRKREKERKKFNEYSHRPSKGIIDEAFLDSSSALASNRYAIVSDLPFLAAHYIMSINMIDKTSY